MTSTKFYLLVKDVVENTDYIFDERPVTKNELEQAFKSCFVMLQLINPNLQIHTHDLYCECFETVNSLNKGWIWNSTELKTQVCYIIRAIQIRDLIVNSDTESICSSVSSNDRPNYTGQTEDYKSELVNEIKYRLSQPNFGLKVLSKDWDTAVV